MENNLMDLFDKRPLSALPVGEPTNAVFTEAKSGKEVEIPVLAWQVEVVLVDKEDETHVPWLLHVKGLVPCTENNKDMGLSPDGQLWDVNSIKDNGLNFKGYRVMRVNKVF